MAESRFMMSPVLIIRVFRVGGRAAGGRALKVVNLILTASRVKIPASKIYQSEA